MTGSRSRAGVGVVVLLLGLSVAGGGVLAAAHGTGAGTTATGEFDSNDGLDSGDDVGSNGHVGTNDEFEPNDDFDSAAEVSLPFEREALRTHVEDFDYFAVDLQRGDRLDVSVLFDHDRGDIDLALYDPNRDLVASSLSSTDGESASIQAGMAGTYYVLVRGWAETETSYTISVTREDGTLPPNDEFEYNDGFSSATLIETPFDRAELRLAPGDVDVYAVELEADRVLNVTARFAHNQSDIDVELYDSDEELITAGLSATDNESLSAVTDSTGVYYIRVSSTDDGAAYYSLSVTDSRAGTPSPTPTATATPTPTGTATATPSTRTATPTSPTVTSSQSPTLTPTVTGSPTASDTTADPSTGTRPDVVTPGFGIGVAAIAGAAAAVLLGRRRAGD